LTSADIAENRLNISSAGSHGFFARTFAAEPGGMSMGSSPLKKLSTVWYALSAAESLIATATKAENTALTHAIYKTDTEVRIIMTHDQFEREKAYRISLAVAQTMLSKGIIAEEDYAKIDTILLEKFRPLLGVLKAL